MAPNSVSLVVADLDGTALERDEFLIADVIGIADRLRGHGIDFTVATGRVAGSAIPYAQALGVELPFITSNGASLCQGTTVLSVTTFAALTVRRLVERSEELELSVVYSLGGADHPTRLTPWVVQRQEHSGQYRHPRPIDDHEWGTMRLEKLLLLDDRRDGRIGLLAEAAGRIPSLEVTRYGDKAVEVVSAGRTKGAGLVELVTMTGHDLARTLAIGDHQNDLSMFAVAGHSAAVGNATPDARKAADYQATRSHGRGLLEAITRMTGVTQE